MQDPKHQQAQHLMAGQGAHMQHSTYENASPMSAVTASGISLPANYGTDAAPGRQLSSLIDFNFP